MVIKVETEEKYYCINPKKLIEKIKEYDFEELDTKTESDEYFTDIESEFIRNRTCLRVRKTNNEKMEVTFKGKSTSLLGQYCKLENNISSKIDEYNNFVSLFTSLGFYSYVEVVKERHTFTKTEGDYRYSIMIDKLPNIGGFVEFEIISEQDAKREDLKIALRNFINKFSDIELKEETRPYRDVVADAIYCKYKTKNKMENIYVNLDDALVKYEKDFFKKYKDEISSAIGTNIKWGEYRKNDRIHSILEHFIDDYLDNLIFDSKELLVITELLDRSEYNIFYMTKINEVFYKHFFGKLNINIDDIIYIGEENNSQLIKKYNIDLNNSILLNAKDLKELISVLLVFENNE
jgi:predicted adenylyl cyclase CyaB